MATKTVIQTSSAPQAIGPYSQAILSSGGDYVFVSGCIGFTPEGKMVEGGILEQTKQALENMKAIVETAGGSLDKVVKTTVLLAGDMSAYADVNKIYSEYFGDVNPPARAAFAVAALPANALIEIDAIVQL
jgi:2-iminobutanoate/2-iminopropanoate deaminase